MKKLASLFVILLACSTANAVTIQQQFDTFSKKFQIAYFSGVWQTMMHESPNCQQLAIDDKVTWAQEYFKGSSKHGQGKHTATMLITLPTIYPDAPDPVTDMDFNLALRIYADAICKKHITPKTDIFDL